MDGAKIIKNLVWLAVISCLGAFNRFGNGKLVIFGDGNMFSAQNTDWGGTMGFIDPNAKYNHKLLLNIIHYLDGLLD